MARFLADPAPHRPLRLLRRPADRHRASSASSATCCTTSSTSRAIFDDDTRPAHTFWTGCGMIRREVFLDFGGFDPRLYPRPAIEDIELGYRLTRAGHRIVLARDVLATHLKRWSLREMVRTDIFRRGVPWMLLIKRSGTVETDLNVKPAQKALRGAHGAGPAGGCWRRRWNPLGPWSSPGSDRPRSSGSTAASTGSSATHGCSRFAAAALPLHLLYYTCCGVSVVIALFQWHVLQPGAGIAVGRGRAPRADRPRRAGRFPGRSWLGSHGGWHVGQHDQGSRGSNRSTPGRRGRGPRPHRRRPPLARPGRSRTRSSSRTSTIPAGPGPAPIATPSRRRPTPCWPRGRRRSRSLAEPADRGRTPAASVRQAGLPRRALGPAGDASSSSDAEADGGPGARVPWISGPGEARPFVPGPRRGSRARGAASRWASPGPMGSSASAWVWPTSRASSIPMTVALLGRYRDWPAAVFPADRWAAGLVESWRGSLVRAWLGMRSVAGGMRLTGPSGDDWKRSSGPRTAWSRWPHS